MKSGRRLPIDGELLAAARMVGGDEGGRQQRYLGAAGDSDRGQGGEEQRWSTKEEAAEGRKGRGLGCSEEGFGYGKSG
ncbi:hypothetical protein BHE74_00004986 [Ensete ventricosum]|nr:hypothetical protein BHE74_00004986 [Ensete ventricosum]